MTRETIGRYKVLGPIGAGGMGEVYAAHDPSLGRKVAIKMLPVKMAADPDTLGRFTQEARSASALNHPNIITIHEVGTDQGTPYIVMEHVEGRDLRSLLAPGNVPMRQVLDIGAQIADGLAAAHERGIVHRDLKPENLMITRDGFVKILDFGLAKVMAPSPQGNDTLQLEVPGTTPGMILGTVGYMSPEQATGKRIDFRSDQFALGAILHELATGKPAFDGDTAIDTLSAILHKTPPAVSRTNPDAPVQLSDIINRLLAKTPDERYASTRDLARELRLLRDRVVAEESGFHPRPMVRARRKPLATALGALAIFLAVAFVMTRDRTPAAPAKQYLAVLAFKDLTGDPNGQLVVDGFAETLTARLASFPNVQVMRPTTTTPITDPRKAARDLGAGLVLTGSMMRNDDRLRVTYSVIDLATGQERRDLVEGTMGDLFAVQDDVAESVARQLNLGGAPPPVRVAVDPAMSQRRYLEAVGHLRRYDSEQSLNSAIAILEGLGQSPSVQAALARAYLYKFQITRQPELAAAAGRAADRALSGDPQSVDVNITLGELRRQTGRYSEAVAAFLRVLSQQPHNADAVLGLAETYKASGDLQKAEESYKQAIALQPNFWGGYNKLGAFYYVNGRYEEAVPQFQKVVALVPDNQRGYNNLGAVYQRLGRYDDAIRVFSTSIDRTRSAQAYSNLGTSYYYAGRYPDAARAFLSATEMSGDDYLYWRNLGDAYRWVPGQEANARRAFTRAVALCEGAISVNASDALAHAALAGALAKLGETQRARAAVIRGLEVEPRDPDLAYEAAVVALLAGSEDEAIERLTQAVRLGFNPADIARDPEFAKLRKSGRLDAVLQQKPSD